MMLKRAAEDQENSLANFVDTIIEPKLKSSGKASPAPPLKKIKTPVQSSSTSGPSHRVVHVPSSRSYQNASLSKSTDCLKSPVPDNSTAFTESSPVSRHSSLQTPRFNSFDKVKSPVPNNTFVSTVSNSFNSNRSESLLSGDNDDICDQVSQAESLLSGDNDDICDQVSQASGQFNTSSKSNILPNLHSFDSGVSSAVTSQVVQVGEDGSAIIEIPDISEFIKLREELQFYKNLSSQNGVLDAIAGLRSELNSHKMMVDQRLSKFETGVHSRLTSLEGTVSRKSDIKKFDYVAHWLRDCVQPSDLE